MIFPTGRTTTLDGRRERVRLVPDDIGRGEPAVLVATRTRLKNRLHAFLGKENLRPTRGKLWFTDRGEWQLRELALPLRQRRSERTALR